MTSFRAYRVHEEDGKVRGRVEELELEALDAGEVVIRAAYSDVNYKDALAATGKAKIMRRLPMVGGVDVAGHVHSSTDSRYKEGDAVVVTGHGMSEDHDGGYAEYVRVPADWIVPLPEGLSLYEAMALGTAGFTAALAVQRMEENAQTPELGPLLVTGATGGVGSFAVDMYSALGYQVVALTGKRDAEAYLKELGAAELVLRDGLEMGERPLEKGRWGGAVDNVGGKVLGWLTRTVVPNGNIASVGNAGGIALETTVLPFILRGVNLLGINSVYVPHERRVHVWQRLAGDLKPRHLARIATRTVTLEELPSVFDELIRGQTTGRTVVEIAGQP